MLAGCLAAVPWALWGCLGSGGGVPAMAVVELVLWANGGRLDARGGAALRGHGNLCALIALRDYGMQVWGGHGARGDDGGGSGRERWQAEAAVQGGAAADGGEQGHGRGSEAGGQGRPMGWSRRVRTGRFGSGKRGHMQKWDAARGIWWRAACG